MPRLYSSILTLFFLSFFLILPPTIRAGTPTSDSQPITHLPAVATVLQAGHSQLVLFINQVRGSECCDAGSVAHLRQQLDTIQRLNIAASFALRYDALTDPQYVNIFKDQFSNLQSPTSNVNLGLFLEITPSLAQASGVEYGGTPLPPRPVGEDLKLNEVKPERWGEWYHAEHAYPLGYTLDDRKKLIDTAVGQFKNMFGYTPRFVTAWMLDTPSIKYLRETHGISIVQITREQWGTDSYTLSGGPIHYPYFADKDWAFLPTAETGNAKDLTLMLRQTISDPVRNYGDPTSAWTSQPNDYARDGKTLEYFKTLFGQILDQPTEPYSLAILGLENSMSQEFQAAYTQQIEYVLKYCTDHPTCAITTVTQLAETQRATTATPVTLVTGRSDQTTAYWITTPWYRVRLLQRDRELAITDLRIYRDAGQTSSPLRDPYTTMKATNLGYWITPFLFDSSRFYTLSLKKTKKIPLSLKLKDAVKNLLLPEFTHHETTFPTISNDRETTPLGITLPTRMSDTTPTLKRAAPDTILLTYTNDSGKEIVLTATEKTLSLTMDGAEEYLTQALNTLEGQSLLPITVTRANTTTTLKWDTHQHTPSFGITLQCPENTCTISPFIDPNFDADQFRETYYPFVFPEVIERPLSSTLTTLYAHNQFAIAGKNPVRFVLIPRDAQGYAVSTAYTATISAQPSLNDISIQPQQGQSGIIFIDAVENRVGKYTVTVQLGPDVQKTTNIYFAPDCKHAVISCVTHLHHAWWYLRSMLQTKLRNL